MTKKYRILRKSGRVVRLRANAQYSEGTEVDTPDGLGVVADRITESFEAPSGEQIEASSDSPAYAVLVEDEDTEIGFYPASELSNAKIDVSVEDPEEDVAGEQSSNARANQEGYFTWPESWRESDQPARLIALKAFAGMDGSFDGCVREMWGNISRPNAFCADFIDRLVGHPYWRGDSWAPGD